MSAKSNSLFTPFQSSISTYELPERFTFPFYYEPHPLALLAAEELQQHLQTQTDWEHDFGLENETPDLIRGKMFGVLVVQNAAGDLGYLSAFSGKIADGNHLPKFVPPVFDMLTEDSYMTLGMNEINAINLKTRKLENATPYLQVKKILAEEKELAKKEIEAQQLKMREDKAARKVQRQTEQPILSAEAYKILDKELANESIAGKIALKKLGLHWEEKIAERTKEFDIYNNEITKLKETRKTKSAALQKWIFDQYQFLNQAGELKNLSEIFGASAPVAGAGECAAPKLLQYAFQHNLKPVAMAEFWWGQSPKSAIRKHRNFYPACQGKCKPILSHMLEGILMDENPLLKNPAEGKTIEIIFEDEHLAVIHKPAEFLSVPGKEIKDSVASRMREKYPEATGPLIVHRLDMSTSGIMLIAKSKRVHHFLQMQFMKRTIKKRYVAILDGVLEASEGVVELPLRTDWNDRPRQLVCETQGKAARTEWKVLERTAETTRIHFFPITGRTHQLRVHAAHALGLNLPIVGDDLYGRRGERLCLHAEWICFEHPVTREVMEVEVKAEF